MGFVRPKKSLGQNFLIDKRVASRIVESVRPQRDDLIFEIGPGTGALTRGLVERSGFVTAIEIDKSLAHSLVSEMASVNFTLVEADALRVDWKALINSSIESWHRLYSESNRPRVRVVANLPYYVSTPIMRRLLGLSEINDMTLMFQEEVVDRMASKPGRSDYGFLSVLVQFYTEVQKLFRVSPLSFKPVPRVWSAVAQVRVRRTAAVRVVSDERFLTLVRIAFAQRRKTILNNLKSSLSDEGTMQVLDALHRCDIDPKRRAETLSLEEFAALHRELEAGGVVTGVPNTGDIGRNRSLGKYVE